MIEIKITGDSATDCLAQMRNLLFGEGGTQAPAAGTSKAKAPLAAVTGGAAPAAPAAEETGNTEPVTIEMIREHTAALVQGGKSDAVKGILTKYKARKMSELKAKDYEAAYADFKAL